MEKNSRFLTLPLLLVIALSGSYFFRGTTSHATEVRSVPTASWSDNIHIFASQRGNPWINLGDGKEIKVAIDGPRELIAGIDSGNARSLSAATADFDEDGMPDLVTGSKIGSTGAISLLRGNVDSVFPNTAEAQDRLAKGVFTSASFLGPARVFSTNSLVPDFIAAGDFDADGHFDIAVAARDSSSVRFLRGNGKGDLVLVKTLELNGNVTAFLADDLNRRDGTNDLIVGIRTGQGSQLLIFEDPYGVMKAKPEVYEFDAPITSLTIGSIEGDAHYDLVVAAGSELAVLQGRDRKLLFDGTGNSAEAVTLSRRTFDFRIEAVAVGEFIKSESFRHEIALLSNDGKVHLLEKRGTALSEWDVQSSVSLPEYFSGTETPRLLSARVSARSVDTLVIGVEKSIHLLTSDITPPKSETEAVNYAGQDFDLQTSLDSTGKITAILPMRLNIDALSDLVVMKDNSVAPTVVQTAPMASLIVDSTSLAPDEDLSNNVCCTVPLNMGACPVGACSLRAAVEQANFSGGAQQINFNIQIAGVPTIPGGTYSLSPPTVINAASQPGGLVQITGTNDQPANIFTGSQTDNCVFRGLVINGVGGNYYMNPQGRNNIFEGNRVGTNADGTAAAGSPVNNTGGIAAQGANLVGGTAPAARNIISTGTGLGVAAYGPFNGNPLLVQGNFIGTDITGTVALGNFGSGVSIQGENLTIGGTTAGAGNVISGTTGDAIFGASGIRGTGGDGGVLAKLIQGNRIGTNAAGTAALPNARFGIDGSTGVPFDTIGGVNPAARNIISGNGIHGIETGTTGASSLTPLIAGNFVGTNAAGSGAIPNGGFGIFFGGSIAALLTSNVVSGNTGGGILYCSNTVGSSDTIAQNLIGTDAGGNNPLGNGGVGLSTSCGGAVGNGRIIGNTIAANGSHGILIDGGYNLDLQDNFIGTNVNGSLNLGNGGDGIRFVTAFSQNDVTFNRITRNAGNGVNLATSDIFSVENFVAHNRIWDNNGLGIDLGGDGVTPNDACDPENGTNHLQNYPVIASAIRRGNNIRVTGTFNSAVGPDYRLRFYGNETADPSGFGEGERSLGEINVAVPVGCQMNFTATVPIIPSSARCVSATATDTDGNTSEFSRCVRIRSVANSFDNDGQADVSIFRPSSGEWWFMRSVDGVVNAASFGTSTDRITPGDYTGDGVSDLAFWRPGNGIWFILRSEDSTFYSFPFGANGDIPAPGDFDGDGKFDSAVFRPSIGTWFILRSGDLQTAIVPFGITQDKPVVADYDGDGLDDVAIFRPNLAEWWHRRSSDGQVLAAQFGSSTDSPVQGDYTGDGKADIAFWRPSTGFWFVLRSEDGSFFAFPWGSNGDIPAPSDYDGDAVVDPAVFRPSTATWFINRSTDGVAILNFGTAGDKPVPSAYIP